MYMANLPFALWAILEFAKSFLSAKIKSRIETVGCEDKLKQRLGGAASANDILPRELGGTQASLDEMTNLWAAEVIGLRTNLRALQTLSIDKNNAGGDKREAAKKPNWFWNAIWPL